jgi:hypothetical protein
MLTDMDKSSARGRGNLGIGQVNRLLIVSAFSLLLSGCSLAAGRDVRAYDTCLARHPQDAVVCEGPRQAYEVDNSILQANSATSASK